MELQILVYNTASVACSLGLEGWSVDFCPVIEQVRAKIHKHSYHSIVLAASTNPTEALDTCKYLRDQDLETPIVVLSDNVSAQNYCAFMERGADEVMPAHQTKMLSAKLNQYKLRLPITKHKLYKNEYFTLDLKIAKCILHNGVVVPLRVKEYIILKHFMERPGVVLTRDLLMQNIFPDKFVLPDTLDMHICNLRKRFKAVSHSQPVIITVPRIGYKYG